MNRNNLHSSGTKQHPSANPADDKVPAIDRHSTEITARYQHLVERALHEYRLQAGESGARQLCNVKTQSAPEKINGGEIVPASNTNDNGDGKDARESSVVSSMGKDTEGKAEAGAKRMKFPELLMLILNLPESKDTISWTDDGKAWKIVNAAKLEKILPLYFKHNSHKSFLRQVNIYGFKRVGVGHYHHPKFRRDKPHLCQGMERKPKGRANANIYLGNSSQPVHVPTAHEHTRSHALPLTSLSYANKAYPSALAGQIQSFGIIGVSTPSPSQYVLAHQQVSLKPLSAGIAYPKIDFILDQTRY